MSIETGALQFYLDHAEETRMEREKFLRGEEVNLDVIPRHIYNSWIRSTALGVNPYITDTYMARNPEQFSKGFQIPYRGLNSFFKCFQFKISLFDQNGKIISDPDTKQDHTYVGEKYIGTTSASVALAEKRPVTCFGYQNFKLPFCKQFCLSSPVFDEQNDLTGIVNIMLPPSQPTQEQYEQGIGLLELMGLMFRLCSRNRDADAGMLELFIQLLPGISDGVVLVNQDGTEINFNQAALDLLGLQDDSDRETLLKRLNSLCSVNQQNKRSKHKEQVNVSRRVNNNGGVYLLKISGHPETFTRSSHVGVAKHTFQDLLGEDISFLRAKNEAFIVAPTTAPVLIQGATGVGKELFAQSIHNASQRRNKPFVAINCGAVPKDLFPSELFGYEAGAFTGASTQGKIGVLEAASGGTLFLDEIESMPLYIQAGFLRCLSSRVIRRVGGISDIPIDLRIISATKIDLLEEEKYTAEWKVKFRSDLYYRLSTCKIYIPALRERRGDILVLTKRLIEQKRLELEYPRISMTDSFMEALYYYDWHGNVRELENTIERAVIFMDPEEQLLTCSLLYPKLVENSDRNRIELLQKEKRHLYNADTTLRTEEVLTIQRYLIQNDCNMKNAAAALGISRQTLYRKIRSNPDLTRLIHEKKVRKRSPKE